jgi:hypothetical protein
MVPISMIAPLKPLQLQYSQQQKIESTVVVKDNNVVHAKTTFEASSFDHIANLLKPNETKEEGKEV